MVIKNTKSFIEFCNEIGIKDNIGKETSSKFIENSLEIKSFDTENKLSFQSKRESISNFRKQMVSLDFNLRESATNCVFSDKNINSKVMIKFYVVQAFRKKYLKI